MWRFAFVSGALIVTTACGVLQIDTGSTPSRTARPSSGPHAIIMSQTDTTATNRVGATSQKVLDRAMSKGAEECIIITERYITSGGDRLNRDRLRKRIDQIIPKNYDGWAMLDWESDGILTKLNKNPTSAEHKEAVSKMVEALEFAKRQRPNTKWSYYSVPHVFFDFADDNGNYIAWHEAPANSRQKRMERATQARELLNAVDWFAPSIYDMWHDDDSPSNDRKGQRAFVRESVAHCVSEARGKPVIPVVWHRVLSTAWHRQKGIVEGNSNKLFDVQEWLNDQVRPAMQAGADGVVWWSADLKMVTKGTLRSLPAVRNEQAYTSDKAANLALLDRLHREYADAFVAEVLSH